MDELFCTKCNKKLEQIEANVDYLGQHLTEKIPRCPECGQFYISEKLATGKIADLELALEEK